MTWHMFGRLNRRWAAIALGALLVMLAGGCSVDTNAIITETVRGGLEATVSSLVDALSAYLAGS